MEITTKAVFMLVWWIFNKLNQNINPINIKTVDDCLSWVEEQIVAWRHDTEHVTEGRTGPGSTCRLTVTV